jgi:hypothetical protein
MAQADVLTPAGEVRTRQGTVLITHGHHPAHRTTHGQTCANTSDQPCALTVTELHELQSVMPTAPA